MLQSLKTINELLNGWDIPGDIEDTLSSLGKDYTRKEVWEVYQKNQAEQMEKY